MPTSPSPPVNDVKAWLTAQAVMVPEEWVEACIEWLKGEHGASTYACQPVSWWCEAVFEQWLHTDLHQLLHPILPSASDGPTEENAFTLEGELCLQVSGFINIGDSYYGQLRRIDGDLSVDLPDLERPNPDFNDDNASQYHSASQMSTTGRRGAIASTPTLAVLLTDGVSTIKAVELGIPRRPVGSIDPKTKFAPGRKVRLRGPLNIRKGVLILPCGSLSAQNVPESQFYILGGEVEELSSEPLVTATDLLRSQLMQKLGLPQDQEPPAWFPGRRRATATATAANRPTSTSGPPPPPTDQSHPPPPPTAAAAAVAALPSQADFNDDDDAIFATVLEELETGLPHQSSASASSSSAPQPVRREQSTTTTTTTTTAVTAPSLMNANSEEERDLEDEVDADVLESALQEIDFSPHYAADSTATAAKSSVSSKPPPPRRPPPPPVWKEQVAPAGTTGSSMGGQSGVSGSDQRARIRRAEQLSAVPVKRPSKTGGGGSILSSLARHSDTTEVAAVASSSSASVSTAEDVTATTLSTSRGINNPFHPFGYLQDIYHEVCGTQQAAAEGKPRKRLRGVYTVRALLMGLQSRLTHNNGERWSLKVRISDGSASLDAEMEDELLKRLIGVSAVEAKAMNQLGRQGDKAQKRRLQSIFSTFQDRLFHLNGLFDILIPEDMDSTPPRLINYRDMDAAWLRDLQQRVSDSNYN